MKEDINANVSPEIRAFLLPLLAQNEMLQQQLNNKDAEISHLKEVIEVYQRMLFGSKSEKTRYLSQMDQMSLFHSDNVSEKHTDEKKVTVVKEHTRETQPKNTKITSSA